MCFQALVGSLRPTIDSETLSEDPKWVFQFVKDKISGMNGCEYVPTDKLSPCSHKKNGGGLWPESQSQWSASSSPLEPESTLEAAEAPASKYASG